MARRLTGARQAARRFNMKTGLHLKLSQHLALTPQLQQSIRLLQLSTLELAEEVGQLLSENPLLERDDTQPQTLSMSSQSGEAEEPTSGQSEQTASDSAEIESAEIDFGSGSGLRRDDDDDADYPQQAASTPSLREHLLAQLGTMRLSDRDKGIAASLIEALDERGYLSETLEEIAALLPAEFEVGTDELEIALKHIQGFDPVGVGAHTLAECLELQLKALRADVPARDLALRIVREHLDALATRDFAGLLRKLHCDADSLRDAQRLIRSLDPYPGAPFASAETRYIVPDVIVKKTKNRWSASLNPDAMPRLRINRMYAEVLQDGRHSGTGPLMAQLQEARWLIKSVQQRFDTILRVAQAIVEQQRQFFDHGEVAMRPLVLREIAEALGLHESTVSRVTRQKFMATPRGIYELKYFFGSQVATDTGGACSATAIRELLRQLVLAEDRRRPLSDNKIAQLLGEQGIVVARRTIAKYRESLRVPPASLRAAL